jgi:hypothetical protein
VTAAAALWIATAALIAQSPSSLPPEGGSHAGPSATTAARQREWLDKYCVGCHNTRNPQPANDPVNLETASVDNLLAHAGTWERVLRKLSVRAMPPQPGNEPATAARRSAPLAWSDSKPTFCSKYAIPDGGGHYRAVRHPMASARCDV